MDQFKEHSQAALQKAWSKVVAKAWADERFKKHLLENPNQVLKENGIHVPGIKYHIHESTGHDYHLCLPPKPKNLHNLEHEQLNAVVGGACGCTCDCSGG